jgi:hypothetical protein
MKNDKSNLSNNGRGCMLVRRQNQHSHTNTIFHEFSISKYLDYQPDKSPHNNGIDYGRGRRLESYCTIK